MSNDGGSDSGGSSYPDVSWDQWDTETKRRYIQEALEYIKVEMEEITETTGYSVILSLVSPDGKYSVGELCMPEGGDSKIPAGILKDIAEAMASEETH